MASCMLIMCLNPSFACRWLTQDFTWLRTKRKKTWLDVSIAEGSCQVWSRNHSFWIILKWMIIIRIFEAILSPLIRNILKTTLNGFVDQTWGVSGWEPQDDPWQEHKRKPCPFIKLGKTARNLTVKDQVRVFPSIFSILSCF